MRAADLDIHELLHFVPEGGRITFAGERVLLLDAVALGLLRKELIETLGATAARAVLTRFGYAHGWRVAETLRRDFPGTATTTGAPLKRACIRYKVSYAPR